MNEDALRAMVREALNRRGQAAAPAAPEQALPLALHASHFRYTLPESEGACLIEPAVPCNHCGYCQSHGH